MSISAGIIVFEGKFLPEVVRQGRKYLPVDAVVAVMFPRVPRHVDPIDIFRELAGVQLHRATWSETRVLQSIEGVSHGKPREGTSPLVLFEDLQRCYPELCRICKRYCSKVDKTREEDCRQQNMPANERDGAKSRDSENARAKRKFDNLSTVNNNSSTGETSLSTGASKAARSADLEPNAESVERECNIGVENKDTAVDIAVDTPQQSNHITNKKEDAKHKSPSNLSTLENKASPSDDVRWVVVDEVTAESESSFVLAVGSCESIDDTPSPLTEPNHSRPVSKTDSCEEDRFSDLPGKEEERPEEFTSHQTVTDVSAPLNCSPTGEALCGVGMQTYPLCTTQTGGEQKDRDDCSDPAVQDSPPGPHLSHSPKPEASVGETPGGSCQLKDSGDTGKQHVLGETPNTRADGRHLQEKTFPDPKGNTSVTKDLGPVAEPPGSFIQHTDHRGNETTSSSVTNSLPPPRRDCEESQKPVVVAHLHSKADKAEASTDSSTDSGRDSQPAGTDARQVQRDRNLWSSLEMLDVCCRTGDHQGRSVSSGPEDEGRTVRGNFATLLRNNGVTLPDVSPPRSSGEIPRGCETVSADAGGRLVKEERCMTDLQVPKKETRNMATTAEREDKGTASDATASSEMTGNGERYGLTINRPVSSLELKHDENKPNDCRGSCNESTDDSGGESIGLIMECVPEPTYTKARFKVPQENATKKTTEVEDCAAAKRWDIAPGSTVKGSRSPSDDQPKREVHKALPSPTETVDGPFPPAQNSSTRCTATTTQDPILTGNPILATLLVESTPRGSTPPSDASPGLNSSPPKDTCNPMSRRDVQPTTAMSVQGSVSTNPSATAHQPPANGVATSPSRNSLSRSPNKQPGAVARPTVGNGDRKAAHLGKVELNQKSVDVVQVGTAFYCRATAVSTGVPSFTSSMLKKLCPIFGVEYISVDQVRAGVMSCFESLGYSQIRCLNFLGARTWRLFALLSFLETAFCKVDRKERPTTETAIRLAREAVSLKVMSNNDLVVRGHAVLIYYRSGGAYIPVKEFQRIYPRMSIDCLMETCAELNVTVALGPPAVVRAIGDTVTTLSSASPDLDDFQVVTVSLDLRDLTKLLVRLENIPETRLQRPQPSAAENPVTIQATQMNVAASTRDSSATKPKCPPPSIEKPVPTSAMKMEVMEVTSDDIAGPKLIRNTAPSVVAGSVGQGPARKATASPTVDEPANPTASTKHAGRANDSRASINPSPSNHTADMNHRESAASLEMQPLSSNTLPTHVTEADKPSKPRGVTKELLGVRVTSDGRIGTMESAAATTLVKTTESTAQSTSNGRKVIGVTTQHRPVPEPRGDTGNTAELVQATIATNTTIGVTVQHRSVPEPRGDTGNTAEPVQATVATKPTVGDIPKDTMAYPPPQDARHCQRGVVDIADQKGSAAGPENQSLCSNTLPANVPEDDKPSKPRGISKELLGVTSDGQIGTTPPATETIPVITTAAQSASNGCKTTTIGVTVQHRPVPELCGDIHNTAEPVQVTVATKSTVGDIPEDKTVYPPQQDARHCHNGVVDIPDQRVNQKGLLPVRRTSHSAVTPFLLA
ncbi:hypothetical protein Bbelb_140550 [Branchiostoma belcheri]|nr:hypothetical protein Bbelb_140550 [Branchiostoma belcheri]